MVLFFWCWVLGVLPSLKHWIIGLLDYWIAGLLDYLTFGLLELCTLAPLNERLWITGLLSFTKIQAITQRINNSTT